MNRYLGAPYPITKHSKGYFHNDDDMAQVKADILSIVLTRPGERVMELDFGCPLERISSKQPRTLIIENVRHIIAGSLKKWEKRVQILDIVVDSIDNDWGVLLDVQIIFMDPADQKTPHSVALQIPLENRN